VRVNPGGVKTVLQPNELSQKKTWCLPFGDNICDNYRVCLFCKVVQKHCLGEMG